MKFKKMHPKPPTPHFPQAILKKSCACEHDPRLQCCDCGLLCCKFEASALHFYKGQCRHMPATLESVQHYHAAANSPVLVWQPESLMQCARPCIVPLVLTIGRADPKKAIVQIAVGPSWTAGRSCWVDTKVLFMRTLGTCMDASTMLPIPPLHQWSQKYADNFQPPEILGKHFPHPEQEMT